MSLLAGQIIKNLIPTEPVIINKVLSFDDMISISYQGVNTKKTSTKMIPVSAIETLELISLEGEYNFKGDPAKFLLYAEAERINSAFQFDPLFAVNCSIVDPLPHQVEAVYKYLLPLPKIRFLLADDTGAGKTIMTGLLIKEMLMRGLIERILIITPGGLTKQWQQDEMLLKFNFRFTLVNRAAFESDPTIFVNSDKIITSIDFLRADDVLNVVKETSWDLIVVDEAHKLSAFDYGRKKYVSKRYRALEELSAKCEHLLLLTATPHRGRRDTFKNLLQLLDEDIFASDSLVTARVKEIEENGANKFFIRRLKEQMRDWHGGKLFKDRYTNTVAYELTPEEKNLYDKVTQYLTSRRREAKEEANIHVSLALMVMQRRLTSSIKAILLTLRHRHKALSELVKELIDNPNLLKQRQKYSLDLDDLDDFDELDDEERESLENIFADPRKFRLFTTAKSLAEIRQEADQVKDLVELAESLYIANQEEQKYKKLCELLDSKGILHGKEKLVIFTEHKDTLDYLEERLKNNGYKIATIHGSKNVDERRDAQVEFAREAHILIATDAAGEGINLQFCRLLINWDIPWNPNRLEQRMGRIHRYGQRQDVHVFNLVAKNTREGKVLGKLLEKLDIIRGQIGDDRVYDVISDVFEEVGLDDIIHSTLDGQFTHYDHVIDTRLTNETIKQKIREQKASLACSKIDYKDARHLKETSDEKRLQPIYIRMFFEKAFRSLDGDFQQIRPSIFKITQIPELILDTLRDEYKLRADVRDILFCFDKQIFLDYQAIADLGPVHYINPGNPVFDALLHVVRNLYRVDALQGAVLVSPEDREDYFAYFIRSQITDNRPHKSDESIANEKLLLVCHNNSGYSTTSPAKLIDLQPPLKFAKSIAPPTSVSVDDVQMWSFNHITKSHFEETKARAQQDAEIRKSQLEESFTHIIVDLTNDINQLQQKILIGEAKKVEEKILKKQAAIEQLKRKKNQRLLRLQQMQQLNMKPPDVIGCAYVVPLNQIEYQSHFGMSRDDEAAAIAMRVAMQYEIDQDWSPEDVSAEDAGYDIRSTGPEDVKRYIEVKGRSAEGGVMLSENEMNRLEQLGNSAWLYIVVNCKSKPELYRINNPAVNLRFEMKSKGVQYFASLSEWKKKAL